MLSGEFPSMFKIINLRDINSKTRGLTFEEYATKVFTIKITYF